MCAAKNKRTTNMAATEAQDITAEQPTLSSYSPAPLSPPSHVLVTARIKETPLSLGQHSLDDDGARSAAAAASVGDGDGIQVTVEEGGERIKLTISRKVLKAISAVKLDLFFNEVRSNRKHSRGEDE